MNILKQLEQRLAGSPDDPDNTFFVGLVQALCNKDELDLGALYELPYEDFELAIGIMKRWRLDRYTKTKDRLRELACLPSTNPDSRPGAP